MQNCASAIFRISGTHAKFNKLSKNWVHLIQFTRYSFKNLLSTLYSMKQTNVYCSTITSVWLYCCKKLLAVLNVHLRGDHYLGSMFRKLRNVAKKNRGISYRINQSIMQRYFLRYTNVAKRWVGAFLTKFTFTHVKILFEV